MMVGTQTSRFRSVAAFTLVELLVVIGIIALLIGILIPSLQAAQRQAQAIVCASNLRQLVLASEIYANDNHGFVPIGRASGYHWVNYWFVDNTDTPKPAFYMFGSMYAAGLIKNGHIAYCPAQHEVGFGYDEQSSNVLIANPWPPVVYAQGVSQSHTKASYSMRPDFQVAFDYAADPWKLPRLKDLKGKAVFADLITHNVTVNTGHHGGLNRAMIDGSVSWVPFSAKDGNTTSKTIQQNLLNLLSTFSTTTKNTAVDNVFKALDLYR